MLSIWIGLPCSFPHRSFALCQPGNHIGFNDFRVDPFAEDAFNEFHAALAAVGTHHIEEINNVALNITTQLNRVNMFHSDGTPVSYCSARKKIPSTSGRRPCRGETTVSRGKGGTNGQTSGLPAHPGARIRNGGAHVNQAASFSLSTRSYRRSIAYAFEARGSRWLPFRMREMVPCGTPVSALMADCVHPKPTSAQSFSDVFMPATIRTRIGRVNTLAHYLFANNGRMDFKEWLQSEMNTRKIGPSDLARMSRVPQPTIFRILSGETKDPRTGTVKKIERALGVESPPLEAPAQHHELIEAWELLTQEQRQQFLQEIKHQTATNRAILEQLAPTDVVKTTVSVRKRMLDKAPGPHSSVERRKKHA